MYNTYLIFTHTYLDSKKRELFLLSKYSVSYLFKYKNLGEFLSDIKFLLIDDGEAYFRIYLFVKGSYLLFKSYYF